MRNRWIVPSAVALLSLALVLLWSRMASQALVPPGDSEAAGRAGLKAPAAGSQTVHEVTLDSAAGGAGRLVTVDDVSLEKTAASTRVPPGEVVTYTLTFSNSGDVTRDLDMVGDVLPQGVTYKRMTDASDVSDDPDSTTGTINWPAPFGIDPLAETVVQWVYFPIVMHRYSPPRFTVSKTAHPEMVQSSVVEAVFTYTVAFHNEGTVPGVLADIRDTLPTGFEFGGMVADQSDVDSAPVGATREITWTGPFTVAGESALTLVYWVSAAPTVGAHTNSATATTVNGKGYPPKAPGQATVYIPYLEEDWQGPLSDYWQPYLDYPGLNSEQWYLQDGVGVGGSTALKHTYWRGGGDGAFDALYMYLGPGSEGWTNYRFEAKVKMVNGTSQGLWFRGAYEESATGQDPVQGYYLVWRTNGDYLKLSRIQEDGKWAYDFQEPEELYAIAHTFSTDVWYDIAVEVVGSNIKAFVDDELVIEWDDDTWSTGTVGIFCYRVASALWDDILVTPLAPP